MFHRTEEKGGVNLVGEEHQQGRKKKGGVNFVVEEHQQWLERL